MTCPHVLGLIDAGPFADYPRAHLDAAWQHARGCATCRPALEAATALSANLAALSQPVPSRDLAAIVLARIARMESDASGRDEVATRAPSGASAWPAWATALGGLGAGLVLVLSGPLAQVAHVAVGVRGPAAGLVAMPSATAGSLLLAVSLALYAVGLFVPLRGHTRR